MPWLNNTAYLKKIDSMAIIIAQAYQLARSRLASASSPVMRAMMQRDNCSTKFNGSNVNWKFSGSNVRIILPTSGLSTHQSSDWPLCN
ncbi:MAG: hypothetical protein ACF8OB_04590 [Phycisphaeraceae bacterium JB051]